MDLGIPWALEVNAPLLRERQKFETVFREKMAHRWEQDVLQAAPIVLGVSSWICNWLRDEIGCERVVYLPNGACSALGDARRGRRIWVFSEQRKVIGFVGSGRPWHCEKTLEKLAKLDAEVVEVGKTIWLRQMILPMSSQHLMWQLHPTLWMPRRGFVRSRFWTIVLKEHQLLRHR